MRLFSAAKELTCMECVALIAQRHLGLGIRSTSMCRSFPCPFVSVSATACESACRLRRTERMTHQGLGP